jgi:hypothetical protein
VVVNFLVKRKVKQDKLQWGGRVDVGDAIYSVTKLAVNLANNLSHACK